MANYKDENGNPPVLIRANQAGVYMGHIGKLGQSSDTLEIRGRQILEWYERLATTQIAFAGPGERSECGEVMSMKIPYSCIVAIINVTKEGWANLESLEIEPDSDNFLNRKRIQLARVRPSPNLHKKNQKTLQRILTGERCDDYF